MAGPTHFNLADPETILKWERELYVEVAKRTALMNKKLGLVGDGPSFLCQRQKEVFKTGGTRATITLRRELRQLPRYGNQVLRDAEEGLRTATFNYEINQIRHATALTGRVTKQRVTWDVWKESLNALGEYFPKVMEAGAMLHLAGIPYDISTAGEWYHVGNNLGVTFANTPRAPDTKHIFRIHEHATDDLVAADTSAILDINDASRLVAMAKQMPIPIRPCMVHGQELYIWFVHPNQVHALKQNSRWLAAIKDTIRGGAINGNPLFTGALGIWDGVLLVENQYVPCGIDSSNLRVANARRSIFCGAQALVLGLAKEYEDENSFTNDQESWDYANNKGVAATILAGIACPAFSIAEQGTTEDFARIVCTSYAQELVTSV